MKRLAAVVLLASAVWLCSVYPARGGEVADQLKGSIDQIILLLRDPALKAPDMKLERRNRIFKVVEERFDFTEMARRSVGEYWQKMSEEEQKDFEVAFANLLQSSYITKIEKYSDEKVAFTDEKPKGDKFYSVSTEILSGGRAIPLIYSLHKAEGRWQVYDVNIEGVSLVTNYLSQFRETLRREGFKGLMQKIDEKVKQLAAV